MWDACRVDFKAFLPQIRLVLLDEVHTLGTDRGPTLEAIVSRWTTLPASDSAPRPWHV